MRARPESAGERLGNQAVEATFVLRDGPYLAALLNKLTGTRLDVAFNIEEDPYSAARGYPPWSATLRDFRPA